MLRFSQSTTTISRWTHRFERSFVVMITIVICDKSRSPSRCSHIGRIKVLTGRFVDNRRRIGRRCSITQA